MEQSAWIAAMHKIIQLDFLKYNLVSTDM